MRCARSTISAAARAANTRSGTVSNSAMIEREGNGFVSLCPELDIASQGDTAAEARANLEEALELFFEVADDI
jgi:hypothetical protein